MSEPKQVDVSVSVSSTSELHSLAAGIIISRALYRAGITYIVLECNTADGAKINQAEIIPQSEMLFRVESRGNT